MKFVMWVEGWYNSLITQFPIWFHGEIFGQKKIGQIWVDVMSADDLYNAI